MKQTAGIKKRKCIDENFHVKVIKHCVKFSLFASSHDCSGMYLDFWGNEKFYYVRFYGGMHKVFNEKFNFIKIFIHPHSKYFTT